MAKADKAPRRRIAGWFLCVTLMMFFGCPVFAQDALADNDTPAKDDRAESLPVFTLAALDGSDEALERVRGVLLSKESLQDKRVILRFLAGVDRDLTGNYFGKTLFAMFEQVPPELESDWAVALGRFESERIAGELEEIAKDAQADPERRRRAVRALGEHRRLFAAKQLFELTGLDESEQVQGWAFEALANLTHQPNLGTDRRAWALWYNGARKMSASTWQRMLHDNLLRSSRDRLEQEAKVRERLIESQRALYRVTNAEQKPGLLIAMLQDPLDSIRALAMDLASQRAEDNGDFGVALRDELRNRLDDKLPAIRVGAATLLGQLLDSGAADRMAFQLRRGAQDDPAVQQAYLMALTKMPRLQALGPGYEMLQRPEMQVAAAGMLAAAHRDQQGTEAFWAQVRDRVRKQLLQEDKPAPQVVTLLGLVLAGDDQQGWSRISGWLGAEDERVREAAARVWAEAARPLVQLAKRSDDPVIRPIALTAIAESGKTSASLKAVATRRPSEAEDVRLWDQAMIALAGRVQPDALLGVIATLSEKNGETRQVREQMLTAALERADKPDPPTVQTARLLIARAQTRVLADAPALVVLDYEAALALTEKLSGEQVLAIRRGLLPAYLADRRIEEALALAQAMLKPEGKLIPKAGEDPAVDVLIAETKRALEQGRREDAGKLVKGIRVLLGVSVSEGRDAQLLKLEAAAVREEPPPPPVEPAS